jgi:MoaA/NifB/PqqE/SkfB family radical SAM enzyme
MFCHPRVPQREFELGLMFSHTCNIACRHCGIYSHPKNRSRMNIADARRYIGEAARLVPRVTTIGFTGGEPFVHPRELEELLRLCREHGLPARVVTNGFWARDPGKGLDLLLRMQDAGLSGLNFSADVWHLEFMEPEVLRNAIECAQLLGYHAIVNMAAIDDTDIIGQFCGLYGIDRKRVCQLDRSAFRSACSDPALSRRLLEKIHVSCGRVVRMGRAAEAVDGFRFQNASEFIGGSCPEVVNRPVIYPDGDFQACCCAGGKVVTFTVGNARRESLDVLYERMLARSHFQFINTFGPVALHDAVRRARPDLPRPETFASICDVCIRSADHLSAEELDHVCESDALRRLLSAVLPE